MPDSLIHRMRAEHKRTHPHCTYGDSPHYVPPSMGEPGFYLCDAKVIDAPEHPAGPLCMNGHPLSLNPHPDAGKIDHVLQVGATWECIACLTATRHKATERYYAAERLLDALLDPLPLGAMPSWLHPRERKSWLRQRDRHMAAAFTLGAGRRSTSQQVGTDA